MNDWDIGKREIEREHLGLFLDAYERATGETFPEMYDSETPDFIGRDEKGHVVGIEITQLRFDPEYRHARRIFPPAPEDPDAWWRLLELLHQKDSTLKKGRWAECERKILVVVLVDTSIEAVGLGIDTDTPDEDGFDEIWLADYSQVEAFGALDLYAIVHPKLKGHFATGDRGQKPYG